MERINGLHFVVSATVNGECLYSEAFPTMLEALYEIGDLMFYDEEKRCTVAQCRCSASESHSDAVRHAANPA